MFTIFFNMDEHRAKVGDYQIEMAKTMLEEGNYRDAFKFLREGVQRSPQNLEGRLLVSEYFIYIPNLRDLDRALKLLEEGLPYAHDNPEYLKRYIQLLIRQQEDQQVIDVSNEILAENPEEETSKLLSTAAATSHLYRGNFDEAEDFIKEYDLESQIEGLLLSTKVSWERGAQRAAIAKLENSIGKFNTNEPIYAQLSQYYRDLGEYEKARQYAVLRNIDAPLAVSPRVDLLYTLSLTGQEERAEAEANAILRQFRNDEKAMLRLANFATDEGQIDLARRIYEQALENDFPIAPFALLLIESHITAKDFEGAISFSEELAKERPDWLEQNLPIFNSLRSVAYYGVGNMNLADIYIAQFLQQPNLRAESLMAVSRRFTQLGGDEFARRVLKQAYINNPKNQAALSNLIEIEIKTGNAAELGNYLKKLLQMRRPSVEILEQAYEKLGSDRFIYTPDRENLLIELNTVLRPQEQAS
ncbi:hypothetical protein [Cerasicoccus maritimus]|uniref:hypothetical protein n=1 Tax=Cerasicoccus maritimus TaxID=490089 RepID=UPI002852C873|nr:hypothetical protein [Cerasicoccus maritimus]